MGLRERKNAAVREATYRAAMALFAEKGFDETTVDEIAERAGISRATYFNHFGTKEGVLRYYGQSLRSRVTDLVEGLGDQLSPLERVRAVTEAMVKATQEHKAELKIIYRISLRDPNYPMITPARSAIWNEVERLLTEAQQMGEVRRDIPARQLAFHLLATVQNAILAYTFADEPLEPLVDAAWKIMAGGIVVAGTAAERDHQA